jgi:hypothetical protein
MKNRELKRLMNLKTRCGIKVSEETLWNFAEGRRSEVESTAG